MNIIDLFFEGIKSSYLDDIYLTILFICSAAMLNLTFSNKKSTKHTLCVWAIDTLILVALFRICYAIQWFIYYKLEAYFKHNEVVYTIFYNTGIWIFILQILMLYLGARKAYHAGKNGALFVVLMVYMYVGLIADYLMPLFLVAVDTRVGKSGWYINFESGGGYWYIIAGVIIGLILLYIYYLFIKKYILIVLKLSEKQIHRLCVIPFISYILYTLFSLVMQYLDIYPGEPKKLVWFIIVFALIISLYIIMYFSLLYGIILVHESSEVNAELKVSATIQHDNLPSNQWKWRNVDIVSYLKTAKEVGGDFYDYYNIDEDHVVVLIADVSGHGIPAAIFMMMVKSLIKGNCIHSKSPAEILNMVNKQLEDNNKSEYFVTVFLAIIDLQTNIMTYCNAGHTYPMIKTEKNKFELLITKNDFILCGYKKAVYHDYKMELKKGTIMLLYTDGIVEVTDRKEKQFGIKRLLTSANYAWERNVAHQDTLDYIIGQMEEFKDNQVVEDDVTIVSLNYTDDNRGE